MLSCLILLGCDNSTLSGRLDRHTGARNLIFRVGWAGGVSNSENVHVVAFGTKAVEGTMKERTDGLVVRLRETTEPKTLTESYN